MPRHFFAFLTVVSLAIFVSADSLRASDLLDEVPNDALGFVYVHNLSAVDAKVGRLEAALQHSLPRPLAFLQQMAGVSEGLKRDGDFLLVLFPEGGDSGGAWRYCVWVPVADYDKFLNSVHAKSVEGIATATIAGEDLLVARHEDWALVMDPDQRERLTELAAATPAPPPMPAMEAVDELERYRRRGLCAGIARTSKLGGRRRRRGRAVGVERAGRRSIWAGESKRWQRCDSSERVQLVTWLQNAKIEFRKWLAAAPELSQALQQVTAAAVGVRLDESGNATAGVRVAINKEFTDELVSKTGKIDLPDFGLRRGRFCDRRGRSSLRRRCWRRSLLRTYGERRPIWCKKKKRNLSRNRSSNCWRQSKRRPAK